MPLPIVPAADRNALAGLYAGGWDPDVATKTRVAEVLAEVRRDGDDAVVRLTQRFDDPSASLATLRRPVPTPAEARGLVPDEIARGLELARSRVAAFHERQLPRDAEHRDEDGTRSAFLVRPLASVGAYVPGGTATLPSSVIMTCVPARIAGVERIVVATPPARDGSIPAATLYACSLCGVDELYAIGGAQAIAALAYGTATVRAVDKIVGPGNVWVTEAKRQVYGICGIDGLAGPSEVLVVADAGAKPEYVAGELLAQAEHDPLARVAAVSRDRALLEAVRDLLAGEFAHAAGRDAIVDAVLAERTWLVEAASDAEIDEVVEGFAPEHLSLQVRDPWAMIPRIRRAGAIFVGDETPVASGDYIAGSNHVLPTSGAGRFSSGLRTSDFVRTMSLVENSVARMRGDARTLAALATFEGLPNHARTATMRAGDDPAVASTPHVVLPEAVPVRVRP